MPATIRFASRHPFLGEKSTFLTTRLILVTILRRKILVFDDETYSRHHF
ncbi:hypothetical protein [Caldibacillus thermoamylovorans]|nr:hypothetical protein [Caldibacillus thermoamylovorans]